MTINRIIKILLTIFLLIITFLFIKFFYKSSNPATITECFGNKNAEYNLIHVHGIDDPSISAKEKNIREKIIKLAKKFNLRVAVPRSNNTRECPKSKFYEGKDIFCWPQSNLEDIKSSLTILQNSADKCFIRNKENIILLGFSNGGYLLNQLFDQCLMEENQIYISVASAEWGQKKIDYSLQKCGKLFMTIGKYDKYQYENALKYVQKLKNKEGDVQLFQFDGGHVFPEETIETILSILLKK